MLFNRFYALVKIAVVTMFTSYFSCFASKDFARVEEGFLKLQNTPKNQKLAAWANYFVGTKYDAIPEGNYVKNSVIVQDNALDCMSLTFRIFELSFAKTQEEAMENALTFRFPHKGQRTGNRIISYQNRFEYGEDMALSGLFGKVITGRLGNTFKTQGTKRTPQSLDVLPPQEALQNLSKFKTGDVIFFVKFPAKRKVEEIVGHIGIISVEKGEVFLIHASGSKDFTGQKLHNGEVVKLPLANYLQRNYFEGIIVTRI